MTRARLVALALILLSAALFFFRLGAPGLFDADEPAYAQAAREMLRSGDWITPHFNGQPRFDKPILFYWLITLSYSILGVSEFAVRLWSALAATGVTLVLAWSARRSFGPPADLWAGLAFSTSLLTAVLARAAVTDMLLTLFVTAAILAGLEALQAPDGGRAWARLAWVASALAVLVKGPIGLLIPGAAIIPALWLLRELRSGLRRLVPWEGPVLFAAVAFPWYALVLAANGWAFVQGFAIKHHLTRYVGTVSSHAGPLWFYFPVLLIGFFPWSAFVPLGVWRAWRAIRAKRSPTPTSRLLAICLSWVATVFLFFSLAGTKLPSYLFPAFPALALLGREALRPLWLAAMMTAVILFAQTAAVPRAYDLLQAALRQFATEAGQLLPTGQPVLVYGLNAPSVVFYADRPVRWLGAGDPAALLELSRLGAGGQPGAVISRIGRAAELERIPGLVRMKTRGGYALFVTGARPTGSR
ncbi:MAG TPA: glycosyltransferase family 39 protein [Candidatus Sulfotelmatobacter sp.]|nr:glycosyltransferase family 39 protein [Candidatus Sulfotelmatobacter sp.]